MAILKVLVDSANASEVLKQAPLLQSYDAFIVVDADDAQAAALAEHYPVEDISAQYLLSLGGRTVDTLVWRSPVKKSQLVKKLVSTNLPEGPHHYVVQFIGPIKPNWLRGIRHLGAKLREHFKNFSYVIWFFLNFTVIFS